MKHDFSAMVYPSSLLPPVQLRDKRPRTRINWKESHTSSKSQSELDI